MSVTVSQAAKHFGVDPVTIRRWLADKCPHIRRGSRGPGRGALLDLQEVQAWRGNVPNENICVPTEEVMQKIATALWHALDTDRADIRAGVERDDAAAVLIIAWESISKTMGRSYPFDRQLEAIQTLMHEL